MVTMDIESVLSKYRRLIYKLANKAYYRMNCPPHLNADDLYQDGVIKCLEEFHKYDESRGNMTSFIHVILTNYYTNMVNRSKNKRSSATFRVSDNPYWDIVIPWVEEKVVDLMDILTPVERAYLVLRYERGDDDIRKEYAAFIREHGLTHERFHRMQKRVIEKIKAVM